MPNPIQRLRDKKRTTVIYNISNETLEQAIKYSLFSLLPVCIFVSLRSLIMWITNPEAHLMLKVSALDIPAHFTGNLQGWAFFHRQAFCLSNRLFQKD